MITMPHFLALRAMPPDGGSPLPPRLAGSAAAVPSLMNGRRAKPKTQGREAPSRGLRVGQLDPEKP